MGAVRPPPVHIPVGTPTLLKLGLLMNIKFLTNDAGTTEDTRDNKNCYSELYFDL